jgi:hypothetical protein
MISDFPAASSDLLPAMIDTVEKSHRAITQASGWKAK